MTLNKYFKNQLVKSAYSFLGWLGDSDHLKILESLDKSQFYASEQLRELQLKKLRQLIHTAFKHSLFWKERFTAIGLEKGDIAKLDSLDKIPVLSKRDIIEHRDQILIQGADESCLIENKSGGTTGSPLSYYLDHHKAAVREAATLRHNLWSEYKIGDRLATIWGATGDFEQKKSLKTMVREIFWGKHILLDSTNISEESINDFIVKWKRFRPEILLAYAVSLHFFVKYLKDHAITLSPVRAIISSAEVLTDEAREEVEGYFGARIYERYGCREVSIIASECPQHDGLHVNAENLFLEFEPIDDMRDGRQLAKILLTDLENHVFPFIRYRLGDVALINQNQKPCACGRSLPKIEAVSGRVSEYIKLKNGRYISGTGLTISLLSKAPGILKTQIIQKSLDKIVLRIVKNDDFDDKSISILKEEFGKLTGDSMNIEFEFPDRIRREKSGKYRLVISEVND
jgi:phenylacetate-CoA ligase